MYSDESGLEFETRQGRSFTAVVLLFNRRLKDEEVNHPGVRGFQVESTANVNKCPAAETCWTKVYNLSRPK